MLIISIFSFFGNVFKRLLWAMEIQDCLVNGLIFTNACLLVVRFENSFLADIGSVYYYLVCIIGCGFLGVFLSDIYSTSVV